jgi:Contractile injection system tube protein
MSFATVVRRAPRVLLVNESSHESMSCLFNPTELLERVAVNYSRLSVVGLSHQPLQYGSTGNRELPGLEFYVDKFFASARADDMDVMSFAGFLRALTVPAALPDATSGAVAPPRVLLLWPNVLTLEAVVTSLELAFRQFGADGGALVYVATVTFEEVRDSRITSEQLREEL